VELASNSSLKTFRTPAALNDLGASYLALSENDPVFLLKAVDEFERAAKLDPKAPEALFNLVIAYRKLHFPKIATYYFHKYSAVDPDSGWQHELANPNKKDEAAVLGQLEEAIARNNRVEAERLFESNVELCRRVAMQYGLSNEDESSTLLNFIAGEMEGRYADKTVSAML